MNTISNVTQLKAVPSEISLTEVPSDRYGFKFIGTHLAVQKTWGGDFADFRFGAATAVKLEDVIRGYEEFPVVNANVIPSIEARLNDVPESWLGKHIYVIGTSFAQTAGEEHVISFCITNKKDGSGREFARSSRPFSKGVEGNSSRVLLFRD